MRFDDELFDYTLAAVREFENGLDQRRVVPTAEQIAALDVFDESLPERGTAALNVIRMLHESGSAATTSSRGGRFFGFVVGGAHPVSVAANWIATAWDQNAALPVLGNTAAKLEEVSARWILDMLGLPPSAGVGFVSGATMAGFTALNSARHKICRDLGYDLKQGGLRAAPRIRLVVSADIHPTNLSALHYLGFGLDDIEWVPVDEQGRMIVARMPALDASTIVIAQAGNINSGAFDPFDALTERTRAAGAWLHVDGAFGGWLRMSRQRADLAHGMEHADSWSLDCHKWLNVPYDSAIAICRHADAMRECFGVSASYLVDAGERVPSHFTPELSRRARGIDVWATLKYLGRDGFAEIIDRGCDQALHFGQALRELGFEILNEVCINQVVFALPADAGQRNEARLIEVMTRVQQEGRTWFGPTRFRGQPAYRMSICSAATTADDLDIALRAIKDALASTPEFSP